LNPKTGQQTKANLDTLSYESRLYLLKVICAKWEKKKAKSSDEYVDDLLNQYGEFATAE